MRTAMILLLLTAGFAVGFPLGQDKGFSTGSEWAFVQANIFAREAGVFMPVNYEAGQFRVILKQPKHLYARAWVLADLHEAGMTDMSSVDSSLNERIQLIRNATMVQ
jgi:hypothetical protein